jgi:TatD DNase family protein
VEKILLTGMSLADVSNNQAICVERPAQCFMTIGVHPYHASEPYAEEPDGKVYFSRLANSVNEMLSQKPTPLTGFGELGLDYERTASASPDIQRKAFVAQLDLMVDQKWDLPLFLHCRAALDDFVEVISPYIPRLPRGGLVHSFVGTTAEMQKLVSLGLHIGVNAFSFATRESLDMVAAIPLHQLQLETDAPWGEIKSTSEVAKMYLANARPLPPAKKRDKWDEKCMVKERNESCAMERVAFVVAGLKGLTVDEVAESAWGNSVAMFGLDAKVKTVEE